jgi:4,5-DOPA dioxygenase extradiol
MSLPSVFVSHGAPTLPLERSPARSFLEDLGTSLGRPRGILCVSAHWERDRPHLSDVVRPETIHDFYGFPDALYRLRYPAPGAPELAARARRLLEDAGLEAATSSEWGLDHGAWVPLSLMYPDAGIPALQLSVQPRLGTRAHVAIGRALAPLRNDGVLILGSGGAVHNLRYFRPGSVQVPDWAARFESWLVEAVEAGDGDSLTGYRTSTPDGPSAHPTEEHYLPLLVAFGAGGDTRGETLHRGFEHGAMSMAAFRFPAGGEGGAKRVPPGD